MCCNSVVWLSKVCYNESIADSVYYNKLYIAEMLHVYFRPYVVNNMGLCNSWEALRGNSMEF